MQIQELLNEFLSLKNRGSLTSLMITREDVDKSYEIIFGGRMCH